MIHLPERVIAVDFETTGLVSAYDSPMGFAAVLFDGGTPTGERYTVRITPSSRTKISIEALGVQAGVNPGHALAQHVAKLFPEDAVTTQEAVKGLADWSKGVDGENLPCIAQKASFDWAFYSDSFLRCTTAYTVPPLGPVWICTKSLARLLDPKARSVSLDALAVAYGLEGRQATGHDAMEDAVLCGRVYFALRHEAIERGLAVG